MLELRPKAQLEDLLHCHDVQVYMLLLRVSCRALNGAPSVNIQVTVQVLFAGGGTQ